MSVPGVEVQVGRDVLQAIAEHIVRMPALTNSAMKVALRPLIRQMYAALKVIPPELTDDDYPLDWQTPRQRRAFWATGGFGRGIPTQRTNEIVNSYLIELIFNEQSGGIFQMTNDAPGAEYVVGDFAQRMHIAQGYVQYAPVIGRYGERAEDVLVDVYFTVADDFAGVY